MNTVVETLTWPQSRLGEGVEQLAQRAGFKMQAQAATTSSVTPNNPDDISPWLEWLATGLGLQAEPVASPRADLEQLLRCGGPAVLKIEHNNEVRFLFWLNCKSGNMRVLGPDLQLHMCSQQHVQALLCAADEVPLHAELDRLISLAGIPKQRRQRVRTLLINQRLADKPQSACWLLRLPATANFKLQLLQAHLPQRLLVIICVFAMAYALEIAGWGLIGKAAINGRLDLAWLSAWLLVVLSIIPLQLLGGWLDAFFALEVSKILKKRLLAGVLQLDLDAVRHQGAGQLLGRVIESQALESLVLNGGFTVLVALIELVFAGAVLASGAGGRMHLLLLMLWVMLTVALSWRYFRQLKTWTLNRLDITQVMIEDMIGHRTRVAQQPASRRNLQEDKMITDYFHHSKVMDDALVPIMGGLSRGWLIVGLIGMAPVFIAGSASTAALAISLGGLLLANRALSGISGGLSALARAGIAWTQVATLFHSAAQPPSPAPFLSSAIRTGQGRQQLIDASDLVFRYRAQGEPVLKSTCLAIFQGERLLIQGSSGSGKSTLASLLIGLRQPESGLLLLNGLDRFTLGDNWHQLATEAPQFHENHILSGSLAFNLLMGRAWPASDQDLKEAEDLCNELGLADLLNRMPSKLLQQVGETGWQLSHGERSRIFLARALLQNAQLTILDESFAALDPATLHKCLQCAFKHAKTLIVIAHP